jgi:hypothetical protein
MDVVGTSRVHAPPTVSSSADGRAAAASSSAAAGLSFAWTYLIGSSRLSRIRHLQLDQLRYHYQDYYYDRKHNQSHPHHMDPPSNEKSNFKAYLGTVCRYFPRLLSLRLHSLDELTVSLIYS